MIHKLITGGEQYLGFALAKLRQLALTATAQGGYAAQHLDIGDARIALRVVKDQQFLRMDGSSSRYEFFTSEHIGVNDPAHPSDPTKNGLASPGAIGPAPNYDAYSAGSLSRLKRNGKVDPIYSSAFAPPGSPPAWAARSATADAGPEDASDPGVVTWGGWQNQKFFEFCYWPGATGKTMLTCTQAMDQGVNAQCGFHSASTFATIFSGTLDGVDGRSRGLSYMSSDLGLDAAPVLYSASGSMAGAPAYPSPSVFWRRAAVQTTASGAAFFICTDNIGRFQVYRVKAYQNEAGAGSGGQPHYRSLPEDRYKLFTPPYPSWVTMPDEFWTFDRTNMFANQQAHQWLWDFDADGKRAVSCPFHSEAGSFYVFKNVPGLAIHEQYFSVLQNPDGFRRSREDTPGLVEFGIEITETGPGEMDFEVAFTLLRNDYFEDSGRFIFNAAYALPGIPDTAVGTLLTAELEAFAAPGNYTAGPEAVRAKAYYPTDDHEVLTDPVYIHNTRFAEVRCTFNTNDSDFQKSPLQTIPVITPFSFRFINELGRDGYLYTVGGADAKNVGPRALTCGLERRVAATPESGNARSVLSVPNVPVEYSLPAPSATTPEDQELFDEWFGRNADYVPTTRSFLLSLELRTLSSLVWTQNEAAEIDEAVLFSHGREVKRRSSALSPRLKLRPPEDSRPATDPLPVGATLKLFVSLMPNFMLCRSGQGFCVSPKGDWSHYTISAPRNGDVEQFDIVSPKNGRRTSHRALFNKAFGQTRGYTFYGEDYPERGSAVDHGSFRTNGMWITF